MARPQKVSHIVQTIMHGVASGQWPVGAALPPSRKLAQNLGVTQVTLLHALDELAELGILNLRQRQRTVVSTEGRERAEELLQQHRKSSSLERLTLLIHEWYAYRDDPSFYWNKVIYQLKTEAALQGLETTVVPFPIKGQVECIRAQADRSNNVSVALGITYELIPALQEASTCGIPLLLHNRSLSWLRLPSVLRDDYAAAWRVGEILRGLGHRNMCLCMGVGWFSSIMGRDRMEGWRAFLYESGLYSQCNPAELTLSSFPGQTAFLRRLLRGPEAPTAFVFGQPLVDQIFDEACWGPLDIPGQLSVVTWDETVPVGRPGAEVPCTIVRVDHQRMAQCIIEMARKIQAGDLCPPSVRVRCDIELTDSIGPPRQPGSETLPL